MCNLYSQTKGQAAIAAMARAKIDHTGNLQRPLPDGSVKIVAQERNTTTA